MPSDLGLSWPLSDCVLQVVVVSGGAVIKSYDVLTTRPTKAVLYSPPPPLHHHKTNCLLCSVFMSRTDDCHRGIQNVSEFVIECGVLVLLLSG